jgi:hypothetical protein
MTDIDSTSRRLHREFVLLLFLQDHRETDRFFSDSGVDLPESTSDQFHYHRTVFSSQIKSKIGNILTKTGTLRIVLNIDDTPTTSKSHSPLTLGNLSSINLDSIFGCSSPPRNPVYTRRVVPSGLLFHHSHHSFFMVFTS